VGVARTLWIDVMAVAAVEGAAIAERLLRWALLGCKAELQGEQLIAAAEWPRCRTERLSARTAVVLQT